MPNGQQQLSDLSATIGPVAEQGRSLKRNIAYAVIGMGFYSASQFAVTVLLAKFANAEILGHYFLALAISTPIILFFGLELRGVFVADTGNDYTFGTYQRLRSTSLLLAALLLAGFLVSEVLRGTAPAVIAFLAAVFAGKLVWALAEMGWGVFNRRERLDLLGIATVLRGVGLVAPYAIILPVVRRQFPGDDSALAWGAVLAAALVVINWWFTYSAFDKPARRKRDDLDRRWDWASVRKLAIRTLPMGLVVMTINLADSFPRVVIERTGSAQALGFFGAIVALTLIGNLVVVQAANAAANRLSLSYRTSGPHFAQLLLKLIGLALVVGIGMAALLIPFGKTILSALYRPEYAEYITELRIVLLAQIIALLTAVFGITVTQMRMFWLQVPAQLITLGATATAALLLIPGDAIRGAAATALVRALTQFILYAACILWGILARRNIMAAAIDNNDQSNSTKDNPPAQPTPPTQENLTPQWESEAPAERL